jgi:hypothetical protein
MLPLGVMPVPPGKSQPAPSASGAEPEDRRELDSRGSADLRCSEPVDEGGGLLRL